MALFSYKTGVWPISLEIAGARLSLNQDGSVQLQLGATEIGQGADTVFSQMDEKKLWGALPKSPLAFELRFRGVMKSADN